MESESLTLNTVCSVVLIVLKTINCLKAVFHMGILSPDTHLLLFSTVEVLPGRMAASLFSDYIFYFSFKLIHEGIPESCCIFCLKCTWIPFGLG